MALALPYSADQTDASQYTKATRFTNGLSIETASVACSHGAKRGEVFGANDDRQPGLQPPLSMLATESCQVHLSALLSVESVSWLLGVHELEAQLGFENFNSLKVKWLV